MATEELKKPQPQSKPSPAQNTQDPKPRKGFQERLAQMQVKRRSRASLRARYQCQMASWASKSLARSARATVWTPSQSSSVEMPRSARSSATT